MHLMHQDGTLEECHHVMIHSFTDTALVLLVSFKKSHTCNKVILYNTNGVKLLYKTKQHYKIYLHYNNLVHDIKAQVQKD